MAQLLMEWRNDGVRPAELTFPDGVLLKTLPEIESGVDAWLDIVGYMEQTHTDYTGNYEFYRKVMTEQANYDENKCFFLVVGEKPVATIAVLCDYETKDGYLHMLSMLPECRGKGLGKLLFAVAVNTLKKEGMERAKLSTDDWRIPAIKSYLKNGFTPNLTNQPDYPERWQKIYEIINKPI